MRFRVRCCSVIIGIAGVATILCGLPSASAAVTAPLVGLVVSTAQSTYPVGNAVPIRFLVTNKATSACALSADPDGSIQVVGATRNGTALSPSFGGALSVNGSVSPIRQAISSVAIGKSIEFSESGNPQFGFSVLTPIRDHSDVAAYWPVVSAGTYKIKFAYQASPLIGSKACAGQSNTFTVAYVISGGRSGTPAWVFIPIGAVIILLLGGAGFLVARSRRRPAHQGAAVALAVVIVLAGLVMERPSSAALATPSPVNTTPPVVNITPPAGAIDQYNDCIGLIDAIDPTLFSQINKGKYPITILLTGGRSDIKYKGPPDSLQIDWNNTNYGVIYGDTSNLDPCAELYHELVHAEDFEDGTFFRGNCGNSNVPFEEIAATVRENQFRFIYMHHRSQYQTVDLEQRHNYDGVPIPKDTGTCRPKKPVLPPIKNGDVLAKAGGESNGDPHITTFDGERYDFQAVGEFTAAASSTNDLDIQVRQAAFETSRSVAVNSAIAMNVSGTHIGFYLEDGLLVVHRAGSPTSFQMGTTTLPAGATITHTVDSYFGDEYTVTWSDGSTASVWRSGPWGLILVVAPAKARMDTLNGLLGNFNGQPDDDVASPGKAPITPTFANLYPTYANSWRITNASSLFDYPSGDTTATYTDLSFPEQPATTATLSTDQRISAQSACTAAGVTNTADLTACTLDVALTGSTDFALSASDLENLVGLPSATGVATPSPTSATDQTKTATISTANPIAHISFTATRGERAYITVVKTTLPRECGAVLLRGTDDNVLATGCTSPTDDINEVVPDNGVYHVDIQPDAGVTGDITLRVVLTTDKSIASSVGGPPVTAAINALGAETQVTFAAKAGQTVFVAASKSTIADQCSIELDSPSHGGIKLGCLSHGSGYIDATTLSVSGTYAVVVDPSGSAVGKVTVQIIGDHNQQLNTTVGASAVTAAVKQPGAISNIVFHGTANEKVQLKISSSTFPGECGIVELEAPDHGVLTSTCVENGTGEVSSVTLASDGDYTVLVDPSGAQVGKMKVAIAAVT